MEQLQAVTDSGNWQNWRPDLGRIEARLKMAGRRDAKKRTGRVDLDRSFFCAFILAQTPAGPGGTT